MKEGEGSKIMLMADFIRIPRVGFKYIVETWFKQRQGQVTQTKWSPRHLYLSKNTVDS